MDPLDAGLLLARVALAALLTGHACQKLFGWFRGMGVRGTGELFETLGFRPGRVMVLLAGASELTAATLLALGLLFPLGAAMAVGTMIVAAAANWSKGLWGHLGGYEVALSYGLMAGVLALTGPGGWSLDALAGWGWPGWAGPAAIALGVLAAVPVLVRRAVQVPVG